MAKIPWTLQEPLKLMNPPDRHKINRRYWWLLWTAISQTIPCQCYHTTWFRFCTHSLKISKCNEKAEKDVYRHPLLWFMSLWKIPFSQCIIVWSEWVMSWHENRPSFLFACFTFQEVCVETHSSGIELLWHHKGHWHFCWHISQVSENTDPVFLQFSSFSCLPNMWKV